MVMAIVFVYSQKHVSQVAGNVTPFAAAAALVLGHELFFG